MDIKHINPPNTIASPRVKLPEQRQTLVHTERQNLKPTPIIVYEEDDYIPLRVEAEPIHGGTTSVILICPIYLLCIGCPRYVVELEEFLDCGEHGRNWVVRVVNCLLGDVLPFKYLVRHQLTVVVLQMCEYACHGVVYGVCCPVADICQISFLGRANNLLDKILLHPCYLMKEEHFLGVRDLRIGVRVGGRSVRNDERTQVSWLNKSSGRY